MGFYILGFIGGLASWLHGHAMDLVCYSTLGVALTMIHWWRDIVVERTYQGMHTKAVQRNYYWGVSLIILSEVFFFFRFFWAFLHNALAPAVEVGCQWPPLGVTPVNPLTWPLFNSIVLLTSGGLANIAYLNIMIGNVSGSVANINWAIRAGILFSLVQLREYKAAAFTIADSVFGSSFFTLTGFHGLHVLVGTLILYIQKKRLKRIHFSPTHNVGLLAAIWY